MEIISRKEAIEKKLSHYFTGKPCKNGHIAKRVTKSRDCTQCRADYAYRYKEKLIKEHGLEEAERILRESNTEHCADWRERHREEQREYMREYMRAYRKTEVGKQKTREASRNHYDRNREEVLKNQKEYYAKNKDAIYERNKVKKSEYAKEYYRANRERILEAARLKRKALKNNRDE